LGQFLPGGLIATSVVERRRAMVNASEGRYLIGTGIRYPLFVSDTERGLSLPLESGIVDFSPCLLSTVVRVHDATL
jgi:hypothetical protein